MDILARQFVGGSASFETFDAKVQQHERRTTKVIDDDVKVGVVAKSMQDERMRDHLILQSKRRTTYKA
eukprot:1230845-Lingulodinium_polyedra.AAC.1